MCNLYDREKYVPQIKNLKRALKRELTLKKVHREIKFNQNAWLKPNIFINTKMKK